MEVDSSRFLDLSQPGSDHGFTLRSYVVSLSYLRSAPPGVGPTLGGSWTGGTRLGPSGSSHRRSANCLIVCAWRALLRTSAPPGARRRRPYGGILQLLPRPLRNPPRPRLPYSPPPP